MYTIVIVIIVIIIVILVVIIITRIIYISIYMYMYMCIHICIYSCIIYIHIVCLVFRAHLFSSPHLGSSLRERERARATEARLRAPALRLPRGGGGLRALVHRELCLAPDDGRPRDIHTYTYVYIHIYIY